MATDFSNVHLRIKVKGKPSDIRTFCQLMRSIDWDFPFGDGKLPGVVDKKYVQCEDCGGVVWTGPQLTRGEIERGARQCKVTIKKISMLLENECQKTHPKTTISSATGLMVN